MLVLPVGCWVYGVVLRLGGGLSPVLWSLSGCWAGYSPDINLPMSGLSTFLWTGARRQVVEWHLFLREPVRGANSYLTLATGGIILPAVKIHVFFDDFTSEEVVVPAVLHINSRSFQIEVV